MKKTLKKTTKKMTKSRHQIKSLKTRKMKMKGAGRSPKATKRPTMRERLSALTKRVTGTVYPFKEFSLETVGLLFQSLEGKKEKGIYINDISDRFESGKDRVLGKLANLCIYPELEYDHTYLGYKDVFYILLNLLMALCHYFIYSCEKEKKDEKTEKKIKNLFYNAANVYLIITILLNKYPKQTLIMGQFQACLREHNGDDAYDYIISILEPETYTDERGIEQQKSISPYVLLSTIRYLSLSDHYSTGFTGEDNDLRNLIRDDYSLRGFNGYLHLLFSMISRISYDTEFNYEKILRDYNAGNMVFLATSEFDIFKKAGEKEVIIAEFNITNHNIFNNKIESRTRRQEYYTELRQDYQSGLSDVYRLLCFTTGFDMYKNTHRNWLQYFGNKTEDEHRSNGFADFHAYENDKTYAINAGHTSKRMMRENIYHKTNSYATSKRQTYPK